MAIREIVVHQGEDPRSAARLEIATEIARGHGARVIAAYTDHSPGFMEALQVVIGRQAAAKLDDQFIKLSENAKAGFTEHVTRHGVSGDWRTFRGRPANNLVTCARYADLAVIGQPDPAARSVDRDMAEEVVLGAGRPVLLVPYAGHFGEIGRRVLVAWNGSRESARAVQDAMPFLIRADAVVIFLVNPAASDHDAGAWLAANLARHGVNATMDAVVTQAESDAVNASLTSAGDFGFTQHGELRHAPSPAISEAAALLSAASDVAADLLVMGAYGHARTREILLGGMTRHLFREMTVPTLMSH